VYDTQKDHPKWLVVIVQFFNVGFDLLDQMVLMQRHIWGED